MKPLAIAVIPARNEETSLPATLRSLQGIPGLSRILVVDDGSRDATADAASRLGAELRSASPPGRGRGKGHALLAGLSRARELGADAILLADADLGASAAHLADLLGALEKERPAAVAAFPRSAAVGGGFGVVRAFASAAIARRTGYAPSEPLSGQRALLASCLDALPGIAPGFGAEVGMTLDLLSAGIAPVEIPLPLQHRPTGKSLAGFAHRARQGIDVLKALRGERLPW